MDLLSCSCSIPVYHRGGCCCPSFPHLCKRAGGDDFKLKVGRLSKEDIFYNKGGKTLEQFAKRDDPNSKYSRSGWMGH